MNSLIDANSTEYRTTRHSDYYTSYSSMPPPKVPGHCTDMKCVLLAAANVIIMVLGITGNGLVIWIVGYKIKKTVSTVWYLSLAVSDLLYCAFLSSSIVYVVKGDWIFGSFMCKFLPFFLLHNWFSSVFLLLIISVDRCVLVMFPVWAKNKRTIHRAWVMVFVAWIISPLLSLPLAIFYDVKENNFNKECVPMYMHEERIAVQTCLFIFGFVIPFLIITICYVLIIRKLKKDQIVKSNKSVKIMTALIAAFFICWMPYHFFNLLALNRKYASATHTGRKIGITLAGANSFLNPMLYVFMRKDFRRKIPCTSVKD